MQPFYAGTPAILRSSELNLIVLVNEVVVGVLRHAEGSKLVPDGFRTELRIGSGEGPSNTVLLHRAEHGGRFFDGLGRFKAQLFQLFLVDIPSAGMVHVLSHQVADKIGMAVRGGDGIARVVEVQAADVVGHDFFRQIFVQRQQQPLRHAVFFHVHAIAQNHIGHLLGRGEHQVHVGGPICILHHGKGHMGIGFFFQFMEEPEVVKVGVLVFQRILESSEFHLVVRQRRSDAQQQTNRQQQGNEFLHLEYLLFYSGRKRPRVTN